MIIMAPADENECRQMLSTGLSLNQPSAIRYPRGQGLGVKAEKNLTTIPLGKAELKRKGNKLAILSFGALYAAAKAAAEKFEATLVNMRFVKPLDTQLLKELAASHEAFITLEDNAIAGGAGSAVCEYLQAQNINIPVLTLGLPDKYIEHGSREECLAHVNLDKNGVIQTIEKWQKLPNIASSA